MNWWICDTTGVAIFDFLEGGGGGTVEDYLKLNGLYPSSTYFYLRTQPRHLSNDEFEDSQGIPPMKLESAPTTMTLFPPGKNNAETRHNTLIIDI